MDELSNPQNTDGIISKDQAHTLLDAVTKIPSLGTTGIIAAIVLLVMTVVVWYWWNNIREKTVNRENEERRAKDQAGTVKDNQDVAKDWDESHNQLEKERTSGDEGKQDIPPKPEGGDK